VNINIRLKAKKNPSVCAEGSLEIVVSNKPYGMVTPTTMTDTTTPTDAFGSSASNARIDGVR